jgi:lipooligosaccharide transport system permease protein
LKTYISNSPGGVLQIKRAFRVWQRHWMVYTKLYKTSFALNFAEPALYLVAMGLGLGAFVKEIHGQPYIKFIAPGIIASSSMFAAVYECTYGTYIRMTFQKTFDAILATPVNLNDLIAGELIWGATKSVIFGITITIVIALFGLVDSSLIVLAIPLIFLCGLIFAEISIIFAAIVPGIDSFSYFYTLFMTPLFLFSGIFFPLDTMPHVVTSIAVFTPLYHLVNICRAFSAGTLSGAVWSIVWIIAAVILLAPFPFRLMKKRIIP